MTKLSKRAIERTLAIVKEIGVKYEKDLWQEVYADRDPETGMPIRDMFTQALEKAETEEEKKYFSDALKSGVFDRKEIIPVPEVAEKMNNEIDARIEEEVKKGNLPKLSLQILKKKTRKYVRKQKTKTNSGKTSGIEGGKDLVK